MHLAMGEFERDEASGGLLGLCTVPTTVVAVLRVALGTADAAFGTGLLTVLV